MWDQGGRRGRCVGGSGRGSPEHEFGSSRWGDEADARGRQGGYPWREPAHCGAEGSPTTPGPSEYCGASDESYNSIHLPPTVDKEGHLPLRTGEERRQRFRRSSSSTRHRVRVLGGGRDSQSPINF